MKHSALISPSTAPRCDGEEQTFQVTHPFHPLSGQVFALVSYHHAWGVDRVYYHNQQGRLCSLPARWTSALPQDPFVAVANGRSPFRPADLLELARLLETLSPVADNAPPNNQSGGSVK